MTQKSVEKVPCSRNIIKQSRISLNELSISTIKEKSGIDSMLDFLQEKHMLNQINAGLIDPNEEYGLSKPLAARCFTKKQKPDHHIPLIRGTSLSRLHNFQNSQNLCFNKEIKRKKISSKSKQKLLEPSSLLTTCYSLKQLKSSSNVQFSNRKIRQLERSTTQISQRPFIDFKSIAKAPRIALKIYEEPLENINIKDNEHKTFMKFYHHLPDDYKIQINDLSNWHKEFDFIFKNQSETFRISQEIQQRNAKRKVSKSLIAIDLKRSRLSKPEERIYTYQCDTQTNPIKKSQIYSSKTRQVVEVSKPKSLDFKNSSFYSSRTEDYESPLSKDSGSTTTGRILQRSQFSKTPEEYGYGYFELPRGTKNMKR